MIRSVILLAALLITLVAAVDYLPVDGTLTYVRQTNTAAGWSIRQTDVPTNGFLEIRMYSLMPYRNPSWFVYNMRLTVTSSSWLYSQSDDQVLLLSNMNLNSSVVNITVTASDYEDRTGGYAIKACINSCSDQCPSDCSTNGWCNITSSVCGCNQYNTTEVPGTDYDTRTCKDFVISNAVGAILWAILKGILIFLAVCCGLALCVAGLCAVGVYFCAKSAARPRPQVGYQPLPYEQAPFQQQAQAQGPPFYAPYPPQPQPVYPYQASADVYAAQQHLYSANNSKAKTESSDLESVA